MFKLKDISHDELIKTIYVERHGCYNTDIK